MLQTTDVDVQSFTTQPKLQPERPQTELPPTLISPIPFPRVPPALPGRRRRRAFPRITTAPPLPRIAAPLGRRRPWTRARRRRPRHVAHDVRRAVTLPRTSVRRPTPVAPGRRVVAEPHVLLARGRRVTATGRRRRRTRIPPARGRGRRPRDAATQGRGRTRVSATRRWRRRTRVVTATAGRG